MENQEQTNNGSKRRRARKSNGNGKTKPIVFKGGSFGAKQTSEIAIIVVYMIQRVGSLGKEDLKYRLKRDLNVTIRMTTLSKVIKSLDHKDILMIDYHEGQPIWNVAKLRFTPRLTEVAHFKSISELLTVLKEDAAGQALSAMFKADEVEGIGKSTFPKNWYHYQLVVMNESPLLGAHPLVGEEARKQYLNSSHRDKTFNLENAQDPLFFDRDIEGKMVIGRNCIKNFIKNGLPGRGLFTSSIQHWWFTDIVICPETVKMVTEKELAEMPIHTLTLPVIRNESIGKKGTNEGAGLKQYEMIPPGTQFVIEFLAPTENYLSVEEMEEFLSYLFKFCQRTISPARGSQYGTCRLLSLRAKPTPWVQRELDKKGNKEED